MIKKYNDDYWIPLADLMTGMMLIFLLIAVILINQINQKTIAEITVKQELFAELHKEFYIDLKKWHANLNESDLSISFMQPEILFDTGAKNLKSEFKFILSDFFPRYVKILTKAKYLNKITEIRIEGHTSSVWNCVTNSEEAYFLNMQLAEARSRETFKYVYFLNQNEVIMSNLSLSRYRWFLKQYVMVSGLSSSHVIKDNIGNENIYLSQRVEFKVGMKH